MCRAYWPQGSYTTKGRWGGETHLTASLLGMQILEGYRHTVPLHPVLVCTLHFLIADDMQGLSNSEVTIPKLAVMAPWCNLVYLWDPARQDTGSCFPEEPDWKSKCALCAALAQHLDLDSRMNHLRCLFQPVLSHTSSSSIWYFLITFPNIFSSASILHINFHNPSDT